MTDIDPSYLQGTPFVRYDPETGEILEHGNMAAGIINQLNDQGMGPYFPAEGTYQDDWFDVTTFEVTRKGNNPATLDGMVIRNVPVPAKLRISQKQTPQATHQVDEDTVELSFEHPGSYDIEITHPRYYPAKFTVVQP